MVSRPYLQLAAAAAGRGTATFSCSLASSPLAFLQDYQLCGAAFLPLGALLEISAHVAAACLGDSDAPSQPLLLARLAVPALMELPADMPAAEMPRLVCSLSTRTGQLVAASASAIGLQHCFSAQLARAAEAEATASNGRALSAVQVGTVRDAVIQKGVCTGLCR